MSSQRFIRLAVPAGRASPDTSPAVSRSSSVDGRPSPAGESSAPARLAFGQRTRVIESGGRDYLFAPLSRAFVAADVRSLDILRSLDAPADAFELGARLGLNGSAAPALRRLVEAGILDAPGASVSSSRQRRQVRPMLTLCPTTDCNLGCVYCYADAGTRPSFLSPNVARTAMDRFFLHWFDKCNEAELVLHGGGEPTLEVDLFVCLVEEFVRRCREFWIEPKIHVVSNGTFGERVRDLMIERGIGLTVSFDGLAEFQNRQRPFRGGAPSFDRVCGNIRRLVDGGLCVGARMTVSGEAVERLDEALALLHDLGVKKVRFEPVNESPRSRALGVTSPSPERLIENFLPCLRQADAWGMEARTGVLCLDPTQKYFCGACGGGQIVTTEGAVTTCLEALTPDDPAWGAFHVGGVNPAVGEVEIDREKVAALRRRHAGNMPDCADCFLGAHCAGGCPMRAFRVTGDLYGVIPEWCDAMREMNRRVVADVADGRLDAGMRRETFTPSPTRETTGSAAV